MFGFRFWRRGEELQVNSTKAFPLYGGSWVTALVLTGENRGAVEMIPEETIRREMLDAAPIVTTCSETIDGDPDTALRLSYQIRVF